jgi:hypothetical protein
MLGRQELAMPNHADSQAVDYCRVSVASGNIGASLGRISTTSWGCKQCDVALCREGGYWEDFHRVE